MTTSLDSGSSGAQAASMHRFYSYLLDLISPGISQLLGDPSPTVRSARTVEINKLMKKVNVTVRVL